ncbi:MAG: hypothetical protein L0211_14520 [Planctomycetaceae bacterium]|nr:hypothetical protein [Planctomycetaceae bacterium]
MLMISQRTMQRILIALGVLALAVLTSALPRQVAQMLRMGDAISLGMMYGTLSVPFALCGFWAVLGTPRLAVRLVQVLAGMATVVMTLLFPQLVAGDVSLRRLLLPAVLSLAGVTLCLLVAGPLWLLTSRRGVRLRHVSDISPVVQGADQQFGIREVLVVTVTIAILLGAMRWLIEIRPTAATGSAGEMIIFYVGMVVLNVFGLLPILIAPLLRRFALALTLIGMFLIAAGTAIEIPIAHRLGRVSSKASPIFWSMNLTQTAWVLLTLGTLRLGGYRLAAKATQKETRE